MGWRLRSLGGGDIEINPADTASNYTLSFPASNGRLAYADAATGGVYLPAGTTAQRPSSPVTGMIRFNTTTGSIESYNGSSWG